MESLWRRTDPLAKRLGVFDEHLTDFVYNAMKIGEEVKKRFKSTLMASQLLELLQQFRPKKILQGTARENFTGQLLNTLSKMEPNELKKLAAPSPCVELSVFFLKGDWRRSSEIFLPQFQGILYYTEAPVLQQLPDDRLKFLFAKRPPLKLVVQHLQKMSEGYSNDKVPGQDRPEFLRTYEFLDQHISDDISALEPLKTVKCILDRQGTLRLARHFSLRLLMDMGPVHAVADDVKPFERFLTELGTRQSVSDHPLPEPFVPDKIMQEMVKEQNLVDLILEGTDGSVLAHRVVCCTVCPKLFKNLVPCEDRPNFWRLKDKARCSLQTLNVMKEIIYSGRVESDRLDQMGPAQHKECLSIAAWFGMAYAHEWLKQYLHGAQPEELASVPASISMPKHWKQQQMPAQGWRLESVKSDIFRKLQGVLNPEDARHLGRGRDCQGSDPYNKLQLRRAWRIENFYLWKKFQHESSNLKELKKNRMSSMPKVTIREELAQATQQLPLPVSKEINEGFLLHGTKPDTVKKILSDGLNERFSGGLFGHGSYLAEDPAKSDQYATPDAGCRALAGHAEGCEGDVCYMFLCRTVLGWFVQTMDGETSLQNGRSIGP